MKEDNFPDLQFLLLTKLSLQDTRALERMPPHEGFTHCIFNTTFTALTWGWILHDVLSSPVGIQCRVSRLHSVCFLYGGFLAFLFYFSWNCAAFVCVYRVILPCLNSSRCFSGVELYLLFSQGYLLHAYKQNVIPYLYIRNYGLQCYQH